ncbi:hypothetical protein BDF14DRAFT_1745383 [Spinellus fusiger]|nr:hypothetical protein BDF14DRAFT_1745383 [Spinellus fusiger]
MALQRFLVGFSRQLLPLNSTQPTRLFSSSAIRGNENLINSSTTSTTTGTLAENTTPQAESTTPQADNTFNDAGMFTEEKPDIVMPSTLAAHLNVPKDLSTSLEAYSGRSIGIVGNPSAAYRRLNSILNQNNVRRELRANTNYEKPNQTRRRARIESNRKLFAAMIRKKVALIMQMKQRLCFCNATSTGSNQTPLRIRDSKKRDREKDKEEWLVFGYEARIFNNKVEAVKVEKVLSEENRYDVRHLLSDAPSAGLCALPNEEEQRQWDEERYADLDSEEEKIFDMSDDERTCFIEEKNKRKRMKKEYHYSYSDKPTLFSPCSVSTENTPSPRPLEMTLIQKALASKYKTPSTMRVVS